VVLTANSKRTKPANDAVLRRLPSVSLAGPHLRQFEMAMTTMCGDPIWRGRKQAEAHDLLALSQVAPDGRLAVMSLDLCESLRALMILRVPVPCRPDTANRLPLRDIAMLGLTYPREAITHHLPGYAFVQILEPRSVWLPAVDEARQALCLGPDMPVGIRVAELVLMSYGALSMQTTQLDERDTAGVFNPESALWWQQNADRIPLSRTPFLRQDDSMLGPGRQR